MPSQSAQTATTLHHIHHNHRHKMIYGLWFYLSGHNSLDSMCVHGVLDLISNGFQQGRRCYRIVSSSPREVFSHLIVKEAFVALMISVLTMGLIQREVTKTMHTSCDFFSVLEGWSVVKVRRFCSIYGRLKKSSVIHRPMMSVCYWMTEQRI